MILTLSVENTNLVMGCFDGDVLRFTSRLAADRNKAGDEYAISFKSILDMHGIRREQITGSIVASVVPALIREIMEALRLTLGKEPLLVGPGVKTGLNILSDNPAALGSDLVVNAVAATNEYPAPLIVIDLDTATTLLAVNEKKAKLLYEFLDSSKLFKGTVVPEDRSLMNIPFVTGSDELDAQFVAEAKKAGFINLKGHRSVGGMRASIYNAMPVEGVEKLVALMARFEKENA